MLFSFVLLCGEPAHDAVHVSCQLLTVHINYSPLRRACLPACLPARLPARLPACLSACLPLCLPACLPACVALLRRREMYFRRDVLKVVGISLQSKGQSGRSVVDG
jgi:hypothetical protein